MMLGSKHALQNVLAFYSSVTVNVHAQRANIAYACVHWKVLKLLTNSLSDIGILLATCKIDMLKRCSFFSGTLTCSHL
jgi:hypothetical protein